MPPTDAYCLGPPLFARSPRPAANRIAATEMGMPHKPEKEYQLAI